MDEDDDDQEQVDADDDYFDSRQYRCCFSLWHAKIGAFVFSTLVFHEIILGTLYMVTRNDVRKAMDFNSSEKGIREAVDTEESSGIPPRLLAVLICRFLQLLCCGLNYVGLWLERHEFIVPFAISQLRQAYIHFRRKDDETECKDDENECKRDEIRRIMVKDPLILGPFSDINTFLLLLEQARKHNFPLLNPHWLNLVLPLIVYASVVVWLMLTLYRCFSYFRAKRKHEIERKQNTALAKGNLQNESLI